MDKQLHTIWDSLAISRLFRTFQLAIAPTRLAIAFGALCVIAFIGWGLDRVTMSVAVDPTAAPKLRLADFGRAASQTELDEFISNPGNMEEYIRRCREMAPTDAATRGGVFTTLWRFTAARFNEATISLVKPASSNIFASISNIIENIWLSIVALYWAVRFHTVYSLVFFSAAGLILCFAGGAICRSAALEYGRGEKPGLIEVLRFSAQKLGSLVSAILIPTGIMLFFATFVFVLGLAANVPRVGEVLLGLGLAVGLVFGLLTSLLMIGIITGANLMFPVVAYEGSNGYDAVSRSLRYVFSRPGWFLLYTLLAAIYGIVAYLLVRLFVYLVLLVTYTLVRLGLAVDPGSLEKLSRIWSRPTFFYLMMPHEAPVGWTETVAATLVQATVLAVIGLLVAFVISFIFSMGTVIYSLMRHRIDNTSMDRIYTQLDEVRQGVDAPEQPAGLGQPGGIA